jgi:hypothetical protein
MSIRHRVDLVVAIVVGVGAAATYPSARARADAGVEVHGFVSQGALVSTGNNYLAHSRRGSLEFFEAALNFSTEVVDRLRVGLQLFARDLGPIGDYSANVDWAYLDYRWREWLGLRAGRIKLPFGLYNEYSDVDSARLAILLPQSMYPVRSRDFLLAQTGLALYGSVSLGGLGGFEYQVALGTIFIDGSENAAIQSIDSKYVAALQAFWRLPVPGLRLGGSAMAMGLAFDFALDPITTESLRMRGAVPAEFMGRLKYEFEDVRLLVASVEYAARGWLVAAEYGRWQGETRLTPPLPGLDNDLNDERFYGLLAYRFSEWFEAGGYYSVHFVDADDRRGRNAARFDPAHRAYQRDLALSLRFDINEHWLFKLEGHYLVGTAELNAADVAGSGTLARSWGLFLAKTTLSF